MPLLNFVPPNDPVLKTQAQEVPLEEIHSTVIQDLIDGMLQIAKGERSDLQRRVLVGLAAPQVGIGKRVILVDLDVDSGRSKLGRLQAYINPMIIWMSEEMELGREGCFSASKFQGIVPRASKIRVAAYDREGNFFIEELNGMTARIFQHEIDHLEGVRFPDRLGPVDRLLWVEDEEYDSFRDNWQNWPKTRPFSDWLEMKGQI